ncbi:hypothetical protein RKD48_003669 [Streptomyces ambofaciens]
MEPAVLGGKLASSLVAPLVKKLFVTGGPGAGLVDRPVRLDRLVSFRGERRALGEREVRGLAGKLVAAAVDSPGERPFPPDETEAVTIALASRLLALGDLDMDDVQAVRLGHQELAKQLQVRAPSATAGLSADACYFLDSVTEWACLHILEFFTRRSTFVARSLVEQARWHAELIAKVDELIARVPRPDARDTAFERRYPPLRRRPPQPPHHLRPRPARLARPVAAGGRLPEPGGDHRGGPGPAARGPHRTGTRRPPPRRGRAHRSRARTAARRRGLRQDDPGAVARGDRGAGRGPDAVRAAAAHADPGGRAALPGGLPHRRGLPAHSSGGLGGTGAGRRSGPGPRRRPGRDPGRRTAPHPRLAPRPDPRLPRQPLAAHLPPHRRTRRLAGRRGLPGADPGPDAPGRRDDLRTALARGR